MHEVHNNFGSGFLICLKYPIKTFYYLPLNLLQQILFIIKKFKVVNCETQEEVDYYWEKLSRVGDERTQQCGWLQDKYSVSWQVVPVALGEMLNDPDSVKSGRVMQAMLQMKKIDINALNQAYEK